MGWKSASESWEWLAQKDALWAILTRADRRNNTWQLDEFFATGAAEIGAVFDHLETLRIAAVDRALALDFGCGVGRLTRALAARFDEAHGVDVSPTMVARARELNAGRAEKLTFFLNERRDLSSFARDHYSFVYSSIVLQHIPYPESLGYVEELIRITKPGGLTVFQVPVFDATPAPLKLARKVARTLVARLRIPVPGLHMEMNVIAREEIARAAERLGAEIRDAVYTNSDDADMGGKIRFSKTPPKTRLHSMQFTLKKNK